LYVRSGTWQANALSEPTAELDPAQPAASPAYSSGRGLIGWKTSNLEAAQQLRELPHAVGPQPGRQRQDLDRDICRSVQPLDQSRSTPSAERSRSKAG